MKTILVATDGSAGAEAAVSAAVQLAGDTGAELRCVGVDDTFDHPGIDAAPGSSADAAAAAARDAGIKATAESRVGPAAERILDAAGECDADLIVVGSRGRGWLKGTVFGSVSAALVRQAERPVLVVKAATRIEPLATTTSAPPAPADAAPAPTPEAVAGSAPVAPATTPTAAGRRPLVAVELPGMAPGDVQLEVADDSLIVRAHHATRSGDTRGYASDERVYARFALPRGTQAADLEATLAGGILTVTAAATNAPVPVPVGSTA